MNPFEETKICSAYLKKCDETGREHITFQYGSSLEVCYPSEIAIEKCEGKYRIQNLSSNIKNINVRCTTCFLLFNSPDMSFTLTEQCAKNHETQITVEIEISEQILVPYFLHLDRNLLKFLHRGEGDSHIIQLPGYEFLTFKCTITKIYNKYELYIENNVYTVTINGQHGNYWIQLDNVNDDSCEWLIEKINFSFNSSVVRQQFIEMSERNAPKNFDSTSSSTTLQQPTAPIATSEAEETGEDLEFFDVNCDGCLKWECEKHKVKSFSSERKKDKIWSYKFQSFDISDKEKEKEENVESKKQNSMEDLRKAVEEIKRISDAQEANLASSFLTKNNPLTETTETKETQISVPPELVSSPGNDTAENETNGFVPQESTLDENDVTVTAPSTDNILSSPNGRWVRAHRVETADQLNNNLLPSPSIPQSPVPSPTKIISPKNELFQTSNQNFSELANSDLSNLVSTLTRKQEFFSKLLNQTKYTDVILVNHKAEEVYGFRCFLAHSSPVLQAIFDSKDELPIRIEVGAFEQQTMKQAVQFSQGDLITVNGNAMNLLKFAKKYAMEILMDCCFSSLAQTITTTNICEYIKFAYDEENAELKKRCLEFLKNNKLAIDPILIKQLPQEILFDAFLS